MFPAERTQIDGRQEEYSFLTGLDCSDLPDMTRQEGKEDADINVLLRKFGVGIPQRQIVYGSADFDMDLQQAYAAIEEVKGAWFLMPEEIRTKYKDWPTLMVALDAGELLFDPTKPAGSKITLKPDEEPPAPKPPTPAPAAS